MNQIVTGCDNCPLMYQGDCDHPKAPEDSEIPMDYEDWDIELDQYKLITPYWCPLKSEPLTLTFKSDGE